MNYITGYISSLFLSEKPVQPVSSRPPIDLCISTLSQKIFDSESNLDSLKPTTFFQRLTGYRDKQQVEEVIHSVLSTEKDIEQLCANAAKDLTEKQLSSLLLLKDRIIKIDLVAKKKIFAPFTWLSKCIIKDPFKNLFSGLRIEKIKGDGHCFFRATAHRLADLYAKSSLFEVQLKHALRMETDSKLSQDLKALVDLLPKGRVESDRLVFALRNLACTYNEKNRKDLKKPYFDSMRKTAAWGGDPEIAALEKVLGVQFCTKKEEISLYDKSKPLITLEHSGNHYDLVLS